jgi:hypothetical protein
MRRNQSNSAYGLTSNPSRTPWNLPNFLLNYVYMPPLEPRPRRTRTMALESHVRTFGWVRNSQGSEKTDCSGFSKVMSLSRGLENVKDILRKVRILSLLCSDSLGLEIHSDEASLPAHPKSNGTTEHHTPAITD